MKKRQYRKNEKETVQESTGIMAKSLFSFAAGASVLNTGDRNLCLHASADSCIILSRKEYCKQN